MCEYMWFFSFLCANDKGDFKGESSSVRPTNGVACSIYLHFFPASVWALHRSTVVELVSGQILTLTFCSGLQLGF